MALPGDRVMRAKVQITKVELLGTIEVVHMTPVAKSSGYPPSGHDEDNDYARWSPSGSFQLSIANPMLFGKLRPGDRLYVDFTRAAAVVEAPRQTDASAKPTPQAAAE